MKKLTRLIAGLSVLAVLMVCMTAVSFAGTAEDKVTVRVAAGSPGSYDYINEHMTVSGDAFEKAFPDLAALDLESGVSYADAMVAANIDKYGEESFKDNLGFAENTTYGGIEVLKQFGHTSETNFFLYANKMSLGVGVGAYQVYDNDMLFMGSYKNLNWIDKFTAFEEDYVGVNVDDEFDITLYSDNWGDQLIPQDVTLKLVNLDTLELTDLPGFTYDKETGKAVGKFDKKGVYYITAVGTLEYDNYDGTKVTGEISGPFVRVAVGDMVTVKFSAGYPGLADGSTASVYDYIGGMKNYQDIVLDDELFVNGSLVEEYFPEVASYECEGVSFADALVEAHIRKYGEANVRNYLQISDGGTWAKVDKIFGREGGGSFQYTNDVSNPTGACEMVIKDGDVLYSGFYANGWSDLYTSFNKKTATVATGSKLTLTASFDTYGTSITPDEAKVKLVNVSTGELKDAASASYKNGKVTISFSKKGTYYVTLDGTVTYDSGYGESTAKFSGTPCIVTVKDAKPAKPVIKSAKRIAKKKASVTWGKAKNAKKYQVAYKAVGAKKWSTKTTTKTKITLTKLNAKKKYQVKVRAINGTLKSAYSKVNTIKIKK